MENYLKNIKKKIIENIDLEDIKLIDNSHLHKGHRFYNKDRYHIKLEIKSIYLKSLTKLNAQKSIMKILKKDLETKIHALEININ